MISISEVTCSPISTGAPAELSELDWLAAPELAVATEHYRRQALAFPRTERQLGERISHLLRTEIGFINNPEFLHPGFAGRMLAAPLGLDSSSGEAAELAKHSPRERLCRAPLLDPRQERGLFQRMNFLRHRAALLRSRLSVDVPDAVQVELVERLVALADWHRDRIVEANLRLVFSIVKKFVNEHHRFDDLLSDGIMALMRAVDKFDFDLGFRFSTYATQVVRRNAYRAVMLQQEERLKVRDGLHELGMDPSDDGRPGAISEQRWHELRSRLTAMLGKLDRREKLIIRARFSLGSHRRVHTLQALAERLGVSKERVRQLEKRALDKLRSMALDTQLAELES